MGQVGLEPTMFVYPVKSRIPSPLGKLTQKNGNLLSCQGTGGGLVRKFGFPSLTDETNISGMGWLVNGPWASWSAVPPVGRSPQTKRGRLFGPPSLSMVVLEFTKSYIGGGGGVFPAHDSQNGLSADGIKTMVW
jgi:hypothetical protein